MNVIPYDTCRRMRGILINDTAHICVGSVPTADFGVCKVVVNPFTVVINYVNVSVRVIFL